MKMRELSLTQAKGVSAISWAVIVLLEMIAFFAPVKALPMPVKIAATVLALAAVAAVLYTTLGRVEKPDERAAENNYKTSSAIYELAFFLFALYVLFGGKLGMETLTVTRSQVILGFAALNLLHDGVFLLYERFGK